MSVVNAIKGSLDLSEVKPKLSELTESIKPTSRIEKAREILQSEIGAFQEVKVPPTTRSKERITLVFGDSHIPWHNEKTLAKILNVKAHRLVINGDFTDCFAASRFIKEYNNVHIKDEVAQARVYLEAFAEKFEHIDLIEGNHDGRYRKMIQTHLPCLADVLPFSLVEIIAKDMKNVHTVSNLVPDTGSTIPNTESRSDHWLMVGDAVIGHWEYFSQVYGRAAEKAYNWMMKWKAYLELEMTPKVIIQGHTHRLSKIELPEGTAIFEGGCTCKPQQYQLRPGSYGIPPQNGYIILVQREGNTVDCFYERLS